MRHSGAAILHCCGKPFVDKPKACAAPEHWPLSLLCRWSIGLSDRVAVRGLVQFV